jgi:2-C-methyl-D-erythritol 4-phosphate cytidylyltransferase
MKKYAIVVAGGAGKRMNSDLPKQFLPLLGKPVLYRGAGTAGRTH